jgi:hypothetical protein
MISLFALAPLGSVTSPEVNRNFRPSKMISFGTGSPAPRDRKSDRIHPVAANSIKNAPCAGPFSCRRRGVTGDWGHNAAFAVR